MKGLLFPYGIWYALAALSALTATGAGFTGDVFNAAGCGLIAVVVALGAVRSRARWTRSGEKALRAELARLVVERAGTGAAAWVHRDARLLFIPGRRRVAGLREQSLMVLDEDLLRDVEDARDAGGGKVAATYTVYRVHPVLSRVVRNADGTTALVTAADVEDAGESVRESWWRAYAGAVRTVRAGLAFADAAELTQVIGQFRDAEPVGPDEA